MRNIIIDLQNSDTSKIQLTIAINVTSSKDAEEEHVIHSKNDNIKFTSYNVNEVVDQLFQSLQSRYQRNLETSMSGSDIIFDSVQMMYYKCCKLKIRRGGSYNDSPDWIKKQKANVFNMQ